jgi:hypothetical protein
MDNNSSQRAAMRSQLRQSGISLVNVGLATLDVPFWWVDFGVRDLRGVELREINSQSMCFVVIIDREMTDNNIATGTYSITSKEDLARKRPTDLLASNQGDYSRDNLASNPSCGMRQCNYQQSVRRFRESGEP